MKNLVQYLEEILINESILSSTKSGKKNFDEKLIEFITNCISTPKTRLRLPKKLKEYPDGIGIRDSEFKSTGVGRIMYIQLYDINTGKIKFTPLNNYDNFSKEFLESVYVYVRVSSDVIDGDDKELEDLCKKFPKIDLIEQIDKEILISAKGNNTYNGKPTYTLEQIERFLKKYRGFKVSFRLAVVDADYNDPIVDEIYDKIQSLKNKYESQRKEL
jgi:hypothetical protein